MQGSPSLPMAAVQCKEGRGGSCTSKPLCALPSSPPSRAPHQQKPHWVPCNVGPSCAGAVGLSCFGHRVCSPAAISISSLPHTGTFLHRVFLSRSSQPGKDPRFLLCSSSGRRVSFYYLFTLYYFLQMLRCYRGGQQREAAGTSLNNFHFSKSAFSSSL